MACSMVTSGFGPAAQASLFDFEDEIESLYFSEPFPPDDLDHQGAVEVLRRPTDGELFSYDTVNTFDSFELETANPEDITGQSLASKMEEDKKEFLQHLNGPAVDASSFGPETITVDADAQDFIGEMEEFLSNYEVRNDGEGEAQDDGEINSLAEELLSLEQQFALRNMDAPCPAESELLNDDDARVAEDILDSLLSQDVELKESQNQASDLLQIAMEAENLQDSGFVEEGAVANVNNATFNVSNVSHFTEEGGDIIVVVTPPKDRFDVTVKPPETDAPQDDDDFDWTPETATCSSHHRKKRGRKPEVRTSLLPSGRVNKVSGRNTRDQKERKKLQNVEAARRYRDRKKREHDVAETEEIILAKKNAALKEQLKDLQNETKTIKKLIVEMGLLRVVR